MRAILKGIFRTIFTGVFTFVVFASPAVAAKAILVDIEVTETGSIAGANIAFALIGKAQSEDFIDSNDNQALHSKDLFFYAIPQKSAIPFRHFNNAKPNTSFAKDLFDAICEQTSAIGYKALIVKYKTVTTLWSVNYKYFLPNTRDRPA